MMDNFKAYSKLNKEYKKIDLKESLILLGFD
jgi:hypothetical protein